jgi:aryl-alcohol dehydrogenase-like predicted oxidoreductase
VHSGAGAKNAKQAAEAAGAMGWRLSADEVAALDAASDRLGAESMGAPFETW